MGGFVSKEAFSYLCIARSVFGNFEVMTANVNLSAKNQSL